MITSIRPSPLKTKRLRAQVKYPDGSEKSFDFGFKSALRFGLTWVDGASHQARDAYWARHRANPVEAKLIDNLVISPATLSAYILWGQYRNVEDNRIALNRALSS
jgi:hypothetical protein